jgi:integrase
MGAWLSGVVATAIDSRWRASAWGGRREAIVVGMHPDRGRVYRRCACRDTTGRQIGARCALLVADSRHGRWAFAVDIPSVTGRRSTLRRCGFASKTEAQAALGRVLACERAGVECDDRQTVAEYLQEWLSVKALSLRPTTLARYRDYVDKDLVPALGAIRLERLHHRHVAQFVCDQVEAGRGLVTLRRCVATLSSALTDAVRQHRLTHNAARYTAVARPPRVERVCWSAQEAVLFLQYCSDSADPLAELYEVIVGTGMRRGEALALHWADVRLEDRVLFVRYTLSTVDNSRPVFNPPKTRSSYAWIALSDRVAAALVRQRERQRVQRLAAADGYEDGDLVFTRHDGRPLRPEYVLRHFHELTDAAGLPRIRVHDLRHFAATMMLSSQVPLAMASKTMRHSTLSTTTEIYGHLLRQVGHDAVQAIERALATAAAGSPLSLASVAAVGTERG